MEKNINQLMDGKRLRTKQVFGLLVPNMVGKGYDRDSIQLHIKWKNLKSEYYKCKRHNNISGNDPKTFDYYQLMDELLNNRPAVELSSGYESQNKNETLDPFNIMAMPIVMLEDDENIPEKHDENLPSTSSSYKRQNVEDTSSSNMDLPAHNLKKKRSSSVSDQIKKFISHCEKQDEEEKNFLVTFLEKEEQMLQSFTDRMLNGMKEIFKSNQRGSESDESD